MKVPVFPARTFGVIATILAMILLPAIPAVAQRFDVTLEVEPVVRGGTPGGTPGLAFTGAPLWLLLAISALLLAAGFVSVSASRRGTPAHGWRRQP